MLTVADFVAWTPDIVDLLKRIVLIESPSTEKAAVDHLVSLVADEIVALKAELSIERQSQVGDQLVARWNTASGQPGILLLCHLDTVFATGTLARQSLRVVDGKLYGPGVLDMKAGIVLALTAIRVLQEANAMPARPITALFTTDEEIGSDYSRPLIEELAKQSNLVLCLEPALADGALKTSRKGTGEIEIITRGKAAHAGADHERGRNAIEELAYHILSAQRLTNYVSGTTVNVGIIRGGTRTNVVPDEAHAWTDFRLAVPEEVDRLLQWAAALQPVIPGAQVEARVTVNRPPMPRDDLMAVTFQKAQQIASQIGLTIAEGSTGGASDANYVAPLGVPVLDGLGALGNGAHSEREYVEIASLPERAALLAALLSEW